MYLIDIIIVYIIWFKYLLFSIEVGLRIIILQVWNHISAPTKAGQAWPQWDGKVCSIKKKKHTFFQIIEELVCSDRSPLHVISFFFFFSAQCHSVTTVVPMQYSTSRNLHARGWRGVGKGHQKWHVWRRDTLNICWC